LNIGLPALEKLARIQNKVTKRNKKGGHIAPPFLNISVNRPD